MPRDRRQFTEEFKREAVQMVLSQQMSFSEVARRLDIRENMLRRWRKKYGDSTTSAVVGPGQPTALEAENRRLREENTRLRMEREILKKAAAFFAKESS